jgi:radical SAM protein with 4Fe4S-binding SPASM domain
MNSFDFNERPFLVIWEVTRACSLACRHCRAEAQPRRHPLELSTWEAFGLIEQIARTRPALFVLTGGDPIQRPDLKDLIYYAAQKGLRIGLTPSATPEFLRVDLRELKQMGVSRLALSVDGAERGTHDRFRGVKGTWDWTMEAIARARAAEIPLQINTTFTQQNLSEFDAFVRLMDAIQPVLWSVFQLVPMGRGQTTDLLSAEQMEWLFERLFHLSERVPYEIKTTEGPHYRRVALQRGGRRRLSQRAPLGINDGKGFVFISHLGEICPSGFLPLSAGNVRTHQLWEVYQQNPLFRALRDSRLLRGKCGRCEFKNVCGGSRARAYAMTGDYLAEEPLCIYQPARATTESPSSHQEPNEALVP